MASKMDPVISTTWRTCSVRFSASARISFFSLAADRPGFSALILSLISSISILMEPSLAASIVGRTANLPGSYPCSSMICWVSALIPKSFLASTLAVRASSKVSTSSGATSRIFWSQSLTFWMKASNLACPARSANFCRNSGVANTSPALSASASSKAISGLACR